MIYQTIRKYYFNKRLSDIRKFRVLYKNYLALERKQKKFMLTLTNFIAENKGKRRDNHYVDNCCKALQLVIDNYQKEINALVNVLNGYEDFRTTDISETVELMHRRLDREEKYIVKELNDNKTVDIETVINDIETYLQHNKTLKDNEITSYTIRNAYVEYKDEDDNLISTAKSITGYSLEELRYNMKTTILNHRYIIIQINVTDTASESVQKLTPILRKNPYYMFSVNFDDYYNALNGFEVKNWQSDIANTIVTVEPLAGRAPLSCLTDLKLNIIN